MVGLGNPGPDYDATRHNVGWWVVDRFAYDRGFDAFQRVGKALTSNGTAEGIDWLLIKPRTFMNRSGEALTGLWKVDDFDASADLLIVTDDANLDVAQVRLRPGGGAGGHNGLKSVTRALGSEDWARLRIGVGRCPPDVDLSDWVLAPMPEGDEDQVVRLLPEMSRAILVWAVEGTEAAMNEFNR